MMLRLSLRKLELRRVLRSLKSIRLMITSSGPSMPVNLKRSLRLKSLYKKEIVQKNTVNSRYSQEDHEKADEEK